MSVVLAWMAGMVAATLLPVASVPSAAAGPLDEESERVLVVMTYAQLGWTGRAAFVQSSVRIAGKLPSVPGVLANAQGIRWLGAEVWTITAWRSEADMVDFVHGAEHGKAMREGTAAIREIKLHRLRCRPDAIPGNWASVKQVLAGELPEGCEWAPSVG